ncbi:hypothetical protein LX76_04601 [Cereibacter changlensis]|uniref:Uncharacterized protein n=1 Tax=Cereibacter changlensis TaxID=402884 RepID=A0A2W7QYN9_9RHOB|nr:hypothetical protein [Cereibacter changlensis]PZX46889.1 hypothetical protein LX76_04601 [Cereibacter changlensis]
MSPQTNAPVASVIAHKITTPAQLRGLALHALRTPETARAKIRADAIPQAGLAWGRAADPRDPYAAFKAHKRSTKAVERKGAPICLHLTCSVSQSWITAEGALHDPDNPRNTVLFEEARAWAESWAGEGAVFAARLDLDLDGGGVVDLFVAPLRLSREKQVISTAKALKELQLGIGDRVEYAALQTSWAQWCQARLDAAIQRGERKGTQKPSPAPCGDATGAQEATAHPEPASAPETALQALQRAGSAGEDEDQQLRDYLLLRREVAAYREKPKTYLPPAGIVPFDAGMMLGSLAQPWPIILGMCSGALEVLRAAANLGITVDDDRKRFAASKVYFPRYVDQAYLGAVLAECGTICAKAEALCKTVVLHNRGALKTPLDPEAFWPFNSAKTLARHRKRIQRMTPKTMQEIAPKSAKKKKPAGAVARKPPRPPRKWSWE